MAVKTVRSPHIISRQTTHIWTEEELRNAKPCPLPEVSPDEAAAAVPVAKPLKRKKGSREGVIQGVLPEGA
jgi:hypothetical protein